MDVMTPAILHGTTSPDRGTSLIRESMSEVPLHIKLASRNIARASARFICCCARLRPGAVRAREEWYFIAELPVPAPHLTHPEGCAALRIVLITVPHASRSCEHFPDGFNHRLVLRARIYLWIG